MASAQIVLLACVVGVGFTGPVPERYMGEYVPVGTVNCADTDGFQVDVFQTNYKCFKPFQGEVYDPQGPSDTCVCAVDQLCMYSKLGNDDPVDTGASGSGSSGGSGGSGSATELTDPREAVAASGASGQSGDSGSAPETVLADEALADLDTYQYRCLNKDESEALRRKHDNPV